MLLLPVSGTASKSSSHHHPGRGGQVMTDVDIFRYLIDKINDMIDNIDGDFPLLDFNSRYMMKRGMRMSLMLIKALQKETEKEQ